MKKGFWTIAFLLVVGGALSGFVGAMFGPQQYSASATLAFINQADTEPLLHPAWQRTLSQEFLQPLISKTLSFRLIMVTPDEMMQRIRENTILTDVALEGGEKGFSLEFTDEDQDTAVETLQMLVAGFGESAASLKGVQNTAKVTRVVDPPHVYPSGSTRAYFTAFGACVGLATALVIRLALVLTTARPVRRESHRSSPLE